MAAAVLLAIALCAVAVQAQGKLSTPVAAYETLHVAWYDLPCSVPACVLVLYLHVWFLQPLAVQPV